jgi:hypothetical protein
MRQTKIHFEIDPASGQKCKNGCGRDCRRKGSLSCFAAYDEKKSHTDWHNDSGKNTKLNYKPSLMKELAPQWKRYFDG